jgi:hypothetical protein
MNKLLLFICVLGITIFGCDGRKTKADSLKESVTKFKDSLSTLEIAEYIPEKYAEVKTDTILSNGFSISIKTYTNMKKSVIIKHKIDTVTYVNHHRDWISEVKIKRKNKLIFDEKIDAEFFLKNNIKISDYLYKVINTRVWINEEASTEKDSISLLTVFLNPEDDNFLIYSIKIGNEGIYSLKKLEEY